MNNPCYKGPGYKCPKRKAECKKTCEDWIKYEQEYFEQQKQKEKIYEQNRDYYDFNNSVNYKGRRSRRNTREVKNE